MRGELLTAPRLKNPKMPKAINDIVLKAMAPEIRARYQRAGELLDDVLAAAGRDAAPDRAAPADRRRRGQRHPDPPQGPGIAAAALLLALPQAPARALGSVPVLRRSPVASRAVELGNWDRVRSGGWASEPIMSVHAEMHAHPTHPIHQSANHP